MQQHRVSLSIAAAPTATLSLNPATAAEPARGYWTTQYGEAIKGGDGECVRTNGQVTKYREDCGYQLVVDKAAEVETGPGGTTVTVTEGAAVVKGSRVMTGAVVVEQVIINNVQFPFDSARLTTEYEASARLAPHRDLLRQGLAQFNMVGHADSASPASYNQAFSERRARSVADYLLAQDPSHAAFIEVIGRGEADPIADNGTEEGRRTNRRVVLQVIGRSPRMIGSRLSRVAHRIC